MYVHHCRACHGQKGDGRGPSSPALRPAPRDLTKAQYKFTRMGGADPLTDAGDLPTDAALYEIVTEGLHGTAMLPWGDVPEPALMDIIHYIKTFSPEGEGWRDEEAEIGKPIEVSDDPWSGKDEEAIAFGKKVFHGKATCQSCHPAFATKKFQKEAMNEFGTKVSFRDNMHYAEAQISTYTVLGVDQTQKPPDYTWDPIRTLSGSTDTKRDLYRIIAAGVNHTAMAAYKGQLDEPELWAVVHYVNHLVAKRDTPAAAKLRNRLAAAAEKRKAREAARFAALKAASAAAEVDGAKAAEPGKKGQGRKGRKGKKGKKGKKAE
jgi:mono/diheme cytochrome c family protein